jgi:hypothetical protein
MNFTERTKSTNERKTNMQKKKTEKAIKVRDLKPRKDPKGGPGGTIGGRGGLAAGAPAGN